MVVLVVLIVASVAVTGSLSVRRPAGPAADASGPGAIGGIRPASGPPSPDAAQLPAPDPTVATPAVPRLGPSQTVETDDVGDPFVLPVPAGPVGPGGHGRGPAGRYVLFWTTDWQSNVPTAVSGDAVHWKRVADALPVLPSWATNSRTMTWGPSALPVAGGWVLYYSTEERSSGLECVGRAFSTRPAGPYVDLSAAPLVCQTGARRRHRPERHPRRQRDPEPGVEK